MENNENKSSNILKEETEHILEVKKHFFKKDIYYELYEKN